MTRNQKIRDVALGFVGWIAIYAGTWLIVLFARIQFGFYLPPLLTSIAFVALIMKRPWMSLGFLFGIFLLFCFSSIVGPYPENMQIPIFIRRP